MSGERLQPSKLWNEYIHRYYYIGYSPLPEAQLRYVVKSGKIIIALMSLHAFQISNYIDE
ncbi:MAG TPA: DUF4338 domain-containing protein [Desulfocapsa sulfexigens]|nr:DUF4338 domain-containing protein [Desulfocapsa sulfexigens]